MSTARRDAKQIIPIVHATRKEVVYAFTFRISIEDSSVCRATPGRMCSCYHVYTRTTDGDSGATECHLYSRAADRHADAGAPHAHAPAVAYVHAGHPRR
jgi:hypothetical protein